MVLDAKTLRSLGAEEAEKIRKKRRRHPVYIILEDVLDTYNIGGFFRLADAIAAEKVYLCGDCAIPPDHKIVKASVGTYQLVDWEYCKDALTAIKKLKRKKVKIIAVEQSEEAQDFRQIEQSLPVAFVFGNESYGVKEKTLKKADATAEVPMHGFNKSLNVMVAAGIVLYHFIDSLPPRSVK